MQSSKASVIYPALQIYVRYINRYYVVYTQLNIGDGDQAQTILQGEI